MIFFKTVAFAFSMFSRIPMPKAEWDEKNMRYMMCVFPLIGIVIGLCLWGWVWICGVMHIGRFLFAIGLTLIPAGVTGGIHLEGFCDTADALCSHASPERKREILKDPHTGAFAVISLCAYLLLYFGACSELIINTKTILLLAFMHTLSRILTGLTVLCFPSGASKGLFCTFKQAAYKKRSAVILSVLLALCVSGMMLTNWIQGGAMIMVSLICGFYLFCMSKRQFGGMSGDLAGYFLQLSELVMLLAFMSIQKAVLL